MFITSFEEQNITYRSCSNLRIHLYRQVITPLDFSYSWKLGITLYISKQNKNPFEMNISQIISLI
ncbi:hypothetical protein EA748_17840 [Acinetobacter ursingii]|nr:hypothetical protein EA748_17840 [Acinetobacter ursingii]